MGTSQKDTGLMFEILPLRQSMMVVMLEDPELTSTHKDTKSTSIYAIIPSEKDLKLAKQLV